jgi:hypothetical protein
LFARAGLGFLRGQFVCITRAERQPMSTTNDRLARPSCTLMASYLIHAVARAQRAADYILDRKCSESA